jgi:hypothetical protein
MSKHLPARARARDLLRAAGLALFSALAFSHRADAQSHAEQQALVDSLAKVWQRAVANQRHLDSVRALAPHDTVRVGSLVVLTDPVHRELVRSAATEALAGIQRTFGDRARSLGAHPMLVRSDSGSSVKDALQVAVLDSTGNPIGVTSEFGTASAVAVAFRRRAAMLLTQELDPTLRFWLSGDVPFDSSTHPMWVNTHIHLATASSRAARDCASGDIARCAVALAITKVPDPAFVWYDARERRELIRAGAHVLRQRGTEAPVDRCTIRGEMSVCDSLIRTIPEDALTAPLNAAARQSLVRLALEMGGDGAFARLAASNGSVADRLSAAARVSSDSLVRAWRAQAMSATYGNTTLTTETALSAVFWATLCGALALRSSRWR